MSRSPAARCQRWLVHSGCALALLRVVPSGPHVGKEAVCGFNEAVFNKFYQAGSTTVEILDEIGDEASSVVRFNMRATARSGNSYDVPPPPTRAAGWLAGSRLR